MNKKCTEIFQSIHKRKYDASNPKSSFEEVTETKDLATTLEQISIDMPEEITTPEVTCKLIQPEL